MVEPLPFYSYAFANAYYAVPTAHSTERCYPEFSCYVSWVDEFDTFIRYLAEGHPFALKLHELYAVEYMKHKLE